MFKPDMPALPEIAPMLAFLGWPEIVGLLAIILTLYHAKHLPPFIRGLGKGMRHFDEASKEVGESVAGIYGKEAAEALTPDNQTAELYDPAVFRRKHEPVKTQTSFLNRIWRRIVSLFRKLPS